MVLDVVGTLEIAHSGADAARSTSSVVWDSAKRSIDLSLAVLGIAAVAPLLLVLVLAIRLESPGPAFYRQTRVGRFGRRFQIVKLRTMHAGAAAMQEQVWAEGQQAGLASKCANDPRVTRMGAFLRRASLDELPQLLNVLAGEMSLVGPRPLQPVEVERLSAHEQRRHHVKPGITGLWQVSGRSTTSWDERMRLDLHYVDRRSARMDFSILCRTFGAVLRQDGAY